MINKDFYPTPPALIARMLEGINVGHLGSVLEPSAGKGDICDYIKRQFHHYHRQINFDVIEIDEELQMILKGKNLNLIHDDFLTFHTHKIYDLIIANFPFSEGEKHLRKALSLLEANGGRLVCLVNAETVKNQFSLFRSELSQKLADLGADIEFLENQFVTAERKTGVEVALIKVTVKRRDFPSIILEQMKQSKQSEAQENAATALVEQNFISQILANFGVECELGIKLIEEYFALKPFIKDQIVKPGDPDYSKPTIELKVGDASDYRGQTSFINEYLEKVRHKYWSVLVNDPRFSSRYTSNILKELSAKLAELKNYDFTLFNIRELEKELASKITKGIEDSILAMFDEFSRQFAWYEECQKNVHYYNGWKTNKAHKINHKIILPINGFASHSWKRQIDDYYIRERLTDMVKVFNYLAETQVNVRQLVGASIERANAEQVFTNIDFRYFETTFYKKGTCHIKFKDLDLLNKLNIYGSQRKGWLPPCYGKVAYDEMDAESRQVVDEFQGKEEYEKVLLRKDFYLVEPKGNLRLAA